MEDSTNKELNTSDVSSILDALGELSQNQVATNDSIKELTEYLIIQDKDRKQAEDTAKKQAEQDAETQLALDEQKEEAEASAKAEQTAKADAQTETYTELLTDIRSELDFQNQLFAGQFVFFGIITGILIGKILLDRFIKL